MTIAQAFNEIAVAQGGTANNSGTIAGAIDALNDALAGADQEAAQTIEEAVRLLGAHIGSGGGGGGSSDFSVAKVTFNITPPEGYEITEESFITAIGFPDYSLGYGATFQTENRIASNVLLYENECHIYEIFSFSGDYALVVDYESITTTGDITYDSEELLFIVTGDGTISGDYLLQE